MKKGYIILIVIVVILIGIRLYLPVLIRNQINNQIAEIEGYSGQVERVSLSLLRGNIQLHNLNLYEDASSDPTIPLVSLKRNEINIHWGTLIRHRVVMGEIYLDSLEVNFVVRDVEKVVEDVDRVMLAEELRQIMPFQINVFRINNGFIHYIDPTTDPPVDIYFADFFMEANNLRNIEHPNDTLPASVRIESMTMGTGYLTFDAGINIMKEIPDFEFELEFENFDITQLNDFTDAYGGFTIDQGLLNLYTEAAAYDGSITGYVKPLIEELEVIPPEEEERDIVQEVYETALDAIAWILQNPETENIGTRVEFEGRIDDPDVATMSAVWKLLRNAFLESIAKGVEGVIDIEDLMN